MIKAERIPTRRFAWGPGFLLAALLPTILFSYVFCHMLVHCRTLPFLDDLNVAWINANVAIVLVIAFAFGFMFALISKQEPFSPWALFVSFVPELVALVVFLVGALWTRTWRRSFSLLLVLNALAAAIGSMTGLWQTLAACTTHPAMP